MRLSQLYFNFGVKNWNLIARKSMIVHAYHRSLKEGYMIKKSCCMCLKRLKMICSQIAWVQRTFAGLNELWKLMQRLLQCQWMLKRQAKSVLNSLLHSAFLSRKQTRKVVFWLFPDKKIRNKQSQKIRNSAWWIRQCLCKMNI